MCTWKAYCDLKSAVILRTVCLRQHHTCIAPRVMVPAGDGMLLSRPLTTPAVSVRENPNGVPIAKTDWPTLRPADVPTLRTNHRIRPSTKVP